MCVNVIYVIWKFLFNKLTMFLHSKKIFSIDLGTMVIIPIHFSSISKNVEVP